MDKINQPIGEQQIKELIDILRKYRNGKHSVDERVQSAERWWKLRNDIEERKEGHVKPGYKAKSGWLHNVLTNKHADALDAYPVPDILPRELGDKGEAKMLSKILPVVLEHNDYEITFSEGMWCKLKTGTAIYKIVWDKNKTHGLGDISITRVNLLNFFSEPGVDDIQQSKYIFDVDFEDEDIVRETYPEQLPEGRAIPHDVITAKMPYDDNVDTSNKVPVISCYYHKHGLLHYVLFVPGTLLYASENDPEMQETGWYEHGKYPYVVDNLFPVEGSPFGYGYIDLCKAPQTEIDILKTAYVENAMVGSKPRYFMRANCGVNKDEFLDINQSLVKVEGSLSDETLQPIAHDNLDGNYISMLEMSISELRETSGNTESSTGVAPSGVTAASAIAALQEAAGKTSRDAIRGTYRAYTQLIYIVIELIRQFYDMPRQFRILGEDGTEEYVAFDNSNLKPQPQIYDGVQMGYRVPEFDVQVVPEKRSAYTKMSNNELAMQFYQAGFFEPTRSDQALACLAMMDFDQKNEVREIIQRNGTMYDRYNTLLQLAVTMAQKYNDGALYQQLMSIAGQDNVQMPTGTINMPQQPQEATIVANARERARNAASIDGGADV